MYTSKQAWYSATDPNGPVTDTRVLPENDPDAKFTLCGVGGVVSDELAAKYDLKNNSSFTVFDPTEHKAGIVAANLATYEDNARTVGGPAHQGIPGAESNPLGVKPDELAKAQTAVENIASGRSSEGIWKGASVPDVSADNSPLKDLGESTPRSPTATTSKK
ncbi:hypothetical protein IAD21_00893 [Abditibacteriota bacterium]|nr:hypothetical protein IAD21_00893 [Abditibacteriota bacterium]